MGDRGSGLVRELPVLLRVDVVDAEREVRLRGLVVEDGNLVHFLTSAETRNGSLNCFFEGATVVSRTKRTICAERGSDVESRFFSVTSEDDIGVLVVVGNASDIDLGIAIQPSFSTFNLAEIGECSFETIEITVNRNPR